MPDHPAPQPDPATIPAADLEPAIARAAAAHDWDRVTALRHEQGLRAVRAGNAAAGPSSAAGGAYVHGRRRPRG